MKFITLAMLIRRLILTAIGIIPALLAIETAAIVNSASSANDQATYALLPKVKLAQASDGQAEISGWLLQKSKEDLYLGDDEEALAKLQQALDIYHSIGDPIGEVTALNRIARVSYDKETNYSISQRYYEQSLELSRRTGNQAGEIDALRGLGNIQYGIDQYEEALSYYEEALELARGLDLKPRIIDLLNDIGVLRTGAMVDKHPLGAIDSGLPFLYEAQEIARQINDWGREDRIFTDLLVAYTVSPNYLEKYREIALETAQASDEHSTEADRLVHQAMGQAIQNKFYEGLPLLIELMITHYEPETGDAYFPILTRIGDVYTELDNYSEAQRYYERSLTFSSAVSYEYTNFWSAVTLNGMGNIALKRGDFNEALNFLNQSLELLQGLEKRNDFFEALVSERIGIAHKGLKNYESAFVFLSQSLEIARLTDDDRVKQDSSLFYMGSIHQELGNYDEALKLYNQSLEIRNNGVNQVSIAEAYSSIGSVYSDQGNFTQAATYFYKSLELLEPLAQNLTDTDKVAIAERQFNLDVNVYEQLQEALIAQDSLEQALEISERGRTQAFIDLLAANTAPQDSGRISTAPPNLADIQKIAKEQQATLVEYSIVDLATNDSPILYIWVISPDGEVDFEKVPLNNIDFQNLVTQTRETIGARGRASITVALSEPALQTQQAQQRQQLSNLYNLLIAPIEQHLPDSPTDPIVFIPHKELFLVPFPALIDGNGDYLIQNHTVTTAPSIQALELTHQQQQRLGVFTPDNANPDDVLLVGNPTMPIVYDPQIDRLVELSSLPGTEREVIDIENQLGSSALLNESATEATVKSRIENARLVHLATHGLLEYGGPQETGVIDMPGAIALARSEGEDGLLTTAELLEMDLQVNLVILSACDTGRGTLTSDGVIGLSRGLMASGVPSVMVSLWKVPDAPTAYLMTQFYGQWQTTGNKAQALRQAMLDTMERYPDPLNWAAFTLMGEGT